ncbi:MAG: tRNA lysidine(34) synthetase TilS [Deltaproteobacteria bacterium]|nr:tRNA lysidine(34) synthetase TilS [Deltaproteobacteria bacterium]
MMLFPLFRKTLLDTPLIKPGEKVVLAISGGLDSMVLLHLFTRVREELDLELFVTHVNYGLRGNDSLEDERLVQATCERLRIPFFVKHWSQEKNENFQNDARNFRHQFFAEIAVSQDAHAIATAHHADDQVETILLHLIRGTGLQGLCGMPMCEPLSEGKLIRPLLDVSREVLEQYAKQESVTFQNDISNDTLSYRRNVIRHQMMPLFRELNPNMTTTLVDMGKRLTADHDMLQRLAVETLAEATLFSDESHYRFSRAVFASVPKSLRVRMLSLIFDQLSKGAGHLNADQYERMSDIILSGKQAGEYSLPSPWVFQRSGEELSISMDHRNSCCVSAKENGKSAGLLNEGKYVETTQKQ